MNNKNKRGYSLVEVVIALTVIVIVSVSALSIVLSSITTKQNAINKSYAQNFADNVWECFKAAYSEEEFITLVGLSKDDEVSLIINKTKYTYESTKNKFTAKITVTYEGNPSKLPSKLYVVVTDKDGDEIISFDYTKKV